MRRKRAGGGNPQGEMTISNFLHFFTASLELWKHSGTAFYLAPARFPGLLSGQPSREQTTTTWQQLTNFYHDIYVHTIHIMNIHDMIYMEDSLT